MLSIVTFARGRIESLVVWHDAESLSFVDDLRLLNLPKVVGAAEVLEMVALPSVKAFVEVRDATEIHFMWSSLCWRSRGLLDVKCVVRHGALYETRV